MIPKLEVRLAVLFVGAVAPVFAHAKTFAEIVNTQVVPLGNTVIGLLFALAFLFFLAGVARMFFSTNEETRQKGRQFAIWGIIGLAVLFSVWGLVNILLGIITSFNT